MTTAPPTPQWQLPPSTEPPAAFLAAVQQAAGLETDGRSLAALLWQRGWRDPQVLPGFLDPAAYQPASPFAFGDEMDWAIARLQQARQTGEKVAIWGDFDADGITATSVLWDGLGQFLDRETQLCYTIPNRLTESHGLNVPGLDRLAAAGVTLIVTCDTGSTNLAEIDYARQRGLDLIITDHHTLPPQRPEVVAILNPRSLPATHPLYHLAGVAVAYKLIEALYQRFPDCPSEPLEHLLDLVAIGLIADLVNLSGDCRYLAQRGLARLQRQLQEPTRPGVAELLKLCKRAGDRPTDISFGLGPRINAVSRVQGDASFCVELLTSRDPHRCRQLAAETELANSRRKALQAQVVRRAQQHLARLDLSTTPAIILADPQWPGGVLGLVAGQLAQEYGRPTVLFSVETVPASPGAPLMARGSARSVQGIDLYDLIHSQAHLLHRFGGHPFAAGLSLPAAHLPLLAEGLNQALRQQFAASRPLEPLLQADLRLPVAALGRDLFRELKALEPCGMGNPVPRLLLENCWFLDPWHQNIQDQSRRKVQYIKTTFQVADASCPEGFPGLWWGHYKDELPQDRPCDALVELDFNTYKGQYEARLIAVRLHGASPYRAPDPERLLDCRQAPTRTCPPEVLPLRTCPTTWRDLEQSYQQAERQGRSLALAYPEPVEPSPTERWLHLIGLAKYLLRTGDRLPRAQLRRQLHLSPASLEQGVAALEALGFTVVKEREGLSIRQLGAARPGYEAAIRAFLTAVAEEQFQRRYFYQVPVATLQQVLGDRLGALAQPVPPEPAAP